MVGSPRGRSMRRILRLVVMAAALTAAAQAFAQDDAARRYPNRAVKIIVSAPPGGGLDIAARVIADRLTKMWGQPFVVENRPGAGGNLSAEAVAQAEPDGYTLLAAQPGPLTTNVVMYKKLSFDPAAFEPLAIMTSIPNTLTLRLGLPAGSVAELIAYAKANPGKLNFGSQGVGTTPHLTGELFARVGGTERTHVPYRGIALALNDLLGGQVQVTFASMPSSIAYIRAGKLRALAVTTATRSEELPDVPTVGEFVPGYEASSWYGLGAPKATPAEIVDKLNTEVNAALADPKMKARLADLGGTPLLGSPADFGKLIAEETEKWAKVVKFSGPKAD